eukprot:TRINITY_DN4403_c7_g1_i1.p1 TRINITY_DN4403_c7_g1~~TRINITY_DN4403_c7_g1_i1.p1  ORF type:complete len:442 (-),score=100.86 TRINITY_DN4403_c7_g1_i1:84-1307(-)
MADTHVQKQDIQAALADVEEFLEHFKVLKDALGEASALQLSSILQHKLGKIDIAIQNCNRAQSIFSEVGDTKGEADALKSLGEIYWKKNEHKASVRMGERARSLYRELGDVQLEVACLWMIAENSVRYSVHEGAKCLSEVAIPRTARDALDKGLKLSEAGLKLARSLTSSRHLVGCLLCSRAQALTLNNRFEEALQCADEAVLVFRDSGHYQLEANSLMLCCDNLRALNQLREAAEAVDEALTLYRHVEDEDGIKLANEVLESLKERVQPAQSSSQSKRASSSTSFSSQLQQQMDHHVKQEAVAAKTDRGKGQALDLQASGVNEEMVKSKVLEVAMRIVGADDGEIEADQPLMEAGLTSASAILLRDSLQEELPGVNLPVTLAFDYPSIRAMSELITQSTGAAALTN